MEEKDNVLVSQVLQMGDFCRAERQKQVKDVIKDASENLRGKKLYRWRGREGKEVE